MTSQIEDRPTSAPSVPRHSQSTLRALEASRELVDLLKLCEKAVFQASAHVDKDALEIVARISQTLAIVGELAELLRSRVNQSAHERSGFWEPAFDPFASVPRKLARRVLKAAGM